MTTTYEFTAFAEADLLSGSDTNLSCGDTFTMPGAATTCISVSDDDRFLSGDSCKNEQANDHTGQNAAIVDADTGTELGNGGQIYAESYFWVKDNAGNWYVMIEIEQEGGSGDFFTFYTGGSYTAPAPGTELTVHSKCNVTSDWIDYKCLDAGEKEENPGSISGRYFNDQDCDGIEDQGEAGFDNKLIKLRDADTGAIVAETYTDQNGTYSFDDVEPGRYCVIFEPMDGFSPTAFQVGSDDTVDSDLKSNGESHIFTVSPGEHEDNIDAGVKADPGWIKGRLTFDEDCNDNEFNDDTGTWDRGVEGKVVQLLNLAGDVVAESTTDSYGNYQFDVPAGQYQVKFPKPDGFKFSAKDSGVDEHFDSDADENGLTDVIDLQPGQMIANIDAGLKAEPACIAGRYFNDENCDGLEGVDEAGFADKLIKLRNADTGQIVAETRTDENGNYSFENVEPGRYCVVFEQIDGFSPTALDVGDDFRIDSDLKSNGESVVFYIGAGQEFKDVDAGLKDDRGSVSGRYFNDENCDGLEGADEAGFADKLIRLRDADTGAIVAETRTDQNGNYSFDNVEPGRYCVIFEQMEGFTPTARDVGSDDTIDSDLKSNGESHIFTVSKGEHEDNIDAGVKDAGTASVSGRYFCDVDRNDVESTGDEGLAGQTVWLLDAGGNVVKTATTDSDGNYTFDDLKGGEYSVRFDGNNNEGKTFVAADAGTDDTIDSDVTSVGGAGNGNTDRFVVAAGEQVENVDAGVELTTGTISGTVWCDDDCDGLQKAGTEECVLGPNLVVNGDFEDNPLSNTGWGLFDAIPGWVALRDKIEVQESNFGTGNTEGNAVVELDANRNAIICQEVNVTEAGTYRFAVDYAMRGTDAGTNGFKVFIDGVEVAEIRPNTPGFQTLELEFDLDPGTTRIDFKGIGASDCIGTVIDNVVLQKKTIVTTPGEDVKEGVTVDLLNVDGSAVLDDAGDAITTVTDANGNYSFEGVEEGNYQVQFTALDGTEFTIQDAGTDDSIDSDVDASGNSGTVTVTAGETTDIDAGLKDIKTGDICGTVWCDVDCDGLQDTLTTTIFIEDVWFAAAPFCAELFNDHNADNVEFEFDRNGNSGDKRGTVELTVDIDYAQFQNLDVDRVTSVDLSALETFLLDNGGHSVRKRDIDLDSHDMEFKLYVDGFGNGVRGDTRFDADIFALADVEQKVTIIYRDSNGDTQTADICLDFSKDVSAYSPIAFDLNGNGAIDVTGDSTVKGHEFAEGATTVTFDLDADGTAEEIEWLDGSGDGLLVDTTKIGAGNAINGEALFGDQGGAFANGFEKLALLDSNGDGLITAEDTAFGNLQMWVDDGDAVLEAGELVALTVDTIDLGMTTDAQGRMVSTASSTVFTEPPKEGVTVSLLDADGNAVLDADGNAITTVTDADGNYSFEDVVEGDYRVQFTAPDGTEFTLQDVGSDDSIDSDVDGSGLSDVISVTDGSKTDIDAGLKDAREGAIEGRAFCDIDGNAVDNAGDTAVVQQLVVLLNPDGTAVLNELGDPIITFTQGDGSYSFADVPVGDYRVGFEVLGGKDFVAQGADADNDGRSDDPAASDVDDAAAPTSVSLGVVNVDVKTTDVFTVGSGETVSDVDAGLFVPNVGPNARDDVFLTDEDGFIAGDLLSNDSDANGDTVTILSADGVAAGTAFNVTSSDGREGSVIVSASGALNFAFDTISNFNDLAQNETDTVTVTYTITDGNGLTDTADVVVTVDGLNDGPDAVNDAVSVDEDSLATADLLANDSDPDASDVVTILSADGVAPGTSFDVTSAGGRTGTAIVAPSGALNFAFDTNGGFNDLALGETDTVTVSYTITDGSGLTDTADVVVTVDGLNDGPDALDDTATVAEDALVSIDLLANDSDPDASDVLTILNADGVAPGTAFDVTSADGRTGTAIVAPSGALNFAFDTNGGFDDLNDGETDTVTVSYTITDGNGLTDTADVTVTVEGAGQPTASVSGTIVNTGPGDRHIAIILDASQDAVNTANAFAVEDFDNDGNVGTAMDQMLSKVSDLALSLESTDLITLLPSGFNGVPDTATVVNFNVGVIQTAIALDEANGNIDVQQTLYSSLVGSYNSFDSAIDFEQAFDAAAGAFLASSGFEQNKVIAMVASEASFEIQGGGVGFFGVDVAGSFDDIINPPSNADVDMLIVDPSAAINAANLGLLDSDGVADVDTTLNAALIDFVDAAPIVSSAADVVSFTVTVDGVAVPDIDISDLTPSADGFDFAPTDVLEGEIDIIVGLDLNSDGNPDQVRALSSELSAAERTLAQGDVFDFTLDTFLSDQISLGG